MLRLRQAQRTSPGPAEVGLGERSNPLDTTQDCHHQLEEHLLPCCCCDHHHAGSHNHHLVKRSRRLYTQTSLVLSFAAGCILSTAFHQFHRGLSMPLPRFWSSLSSKSCRISLGTYHGHQYQGPDQVGLSECLVESKFLKVQQHHVRMTNQHQDAVVIPDWLWIDYHDRINVLVQAPNTTTTQSSSVSVDPPKFLVLEQTKYALEGKISLAIVGGIIEPGEEPRHAALREVQEELHLDCHELVFLGRYRTDVNRGMGWTNTFLASQCTPIVQSKTKDREVVIGEGEGEEVGAADTERQDVKTLTLSELREAVQAGRFLEIQWSATVALALLHLEA